MTCEELLQIAARIGRGLLESGAEIYRVESSVGIVMGAYDLGASQVFAIPTYLHIDIVDNDGVTHSNMCRASTLKSVDMRRLNAFNQLCRTIVERRPEATEVFAELSRIEKIKAYPLWVQILATALGTGAFALFFGGNGQDAVAAALCGAVVAPVLYAMGRMESNLFYKSIIGSAVGALLACLLVHIGLGVNRNEIIIGVFMALVPGIIITNFMRDLIVGDWVTGMTQLLEGMLIATGIALGAGIVLSLAQIV